MWGAPAATTSCTGSTGVLILSITGEVLNGSEIELKNFCSRFTTFLSGSVSLIKVVFFEFLTLVLTTIITFSAFSIFLRFFFLNNNKIFNRLLNNFFELFNLFLNDFYSFFDLSCLFCYCLLHLSL